MMANALFGQRGLTLLELMIAMTLGMLIMLTATGLLLSSKAAYISQNQLATVQESGRYALQVIARAVRQTSYPALNDAVMAIALPPTMPASVDGRDAMTLTKSSAGLESARKAGVVNGSDILALAFFGDGNTGTDSGTLLNCAGLVAPAVIAAEPLEPQRSWSIFFVAKDSQGEPELRCKYRTSRGWNADAIVRGVETFQVLYGIDESGNGLPDYFLNAVKVDALDEKLQLSGNNAVERAMDLQRKTHWKKVRAIRFALLIRGSEAARDDALIDIHDLFGATYSKLFSATDKGIQLDEANFPAKERNRIRKIFTQTVYLRNDADGESE